MGIEQLIECSGKRLDNGELVHGAYVPDYALDNPSEAGWIVDREYGIHYAVEPKTVELLKETQKNVEFSELESRIVNIHFDDLEKFIHDETIASSIEDLYESVCENKLVNLALSNDFLDPTQNWSKAETMYYFAKFLAKKGGCLVELQTPIPSKIKKDESGAIRGWVSSGFGLCRVTRLYIDNLANLAQGIDEFERALFEEIYQKEQQKSA